MPGNTAATCRICPEANCAYIVRMFSDGELCAEFKVKRPGPIRHKCKKDTSHMTSVLLLSIVSIVLRKPRHL